MLVVKTCQRTNFFHLFLSIFHSDALEIISASAQHANDSMKKTVSPG